MGSGTNVKGNFFIPEIFTDAVEAGFAGMQALLGTGAAIVNTSLPAGPDNVGEKVKVPYFTLIGDLDDIDSDGGELSPAQLTSAAEEAQVRHSGKGVEFTRWARMNPTDPYAEGSRQMVEATTRRADKALIDVASANVSNEWDDYTVDLYSASAPKVLGYDQIVTGISKLGDEGFGEKPAVMVVHSKVMKDLRLDKDGTGRPKLVTMPTGVMVPVIDGLGIPVVTSDKLTSTNGKYTSLLLWPESLVFWMNGTPLILSEQNARKPSDAEYVHIYWAAHRYKNRRRKSKPGVVHLKHN